MSGEVFVMKAGGSTSLFAVIAVTYPSGSICTCGGKAAKDTSGYALFPVKIGTYTVECHTSDNSKSKSTSVTITASDKGKSKSVTLSYETYYYNKGDKCTDVTGGWAKTGTGGSLTFNTASMTLVANSYQNVVDASTTNKVDLTNIKTLYFSVKSATTYGTQGYPRVGVAATNNPKSSDSSQWAVSKTLSASSAFTTVSIDVSSLTGSYYIVVGGYQGDAGPATIEIQSIWGKDE